MTDIDQTHLNHVNDATQALTTFHDRIRTSLDVLDEMAREARENAQVDVVKAKALVEFFEGPLIWHDTDEETLLLPAMRRAELADPDRLIVDACTRAHDHLEDQIDELLPELRALTSSGVGADATRLALAARELRELLEPHMRLEEAEIFPIARKVLGPGRLAEMATELDRRRAERLAGKGKNAVALD